MLEQSSKVCKYATLSLILACLERSTSSGLEEKVMNLSWNSPSSLQAVNKHIASAIFKALPIVMEPDPSRTTSVLLLILESSSIFFQVTSK